MFCTYCGSQNSEGTKYCGNCGKPLVPIPTQNTVNPNLPVPSQSNTATPTVTVDSSPKTKVGPKWASIGASLVLLCFFMPWLMVSCSGMAVRVSGWQLSTGNYGNGYQNQVQAYPAIFLILLFGLIGFACLNGKRSGAIAAMASGVAGIIGMILVSSNLGSQTTLYVQVSYEVGYYGEWLGFLIMAGVGFFAFKQMSSYSSNITPSIRQGNLNNPIASTPSSPPPAANTDPQRKEISDKKSVYKPCPNCGKSLLRNTNTCPYCEHPVPDGFWS
jgi:hypothetical protein